MRRPTRLPAAFALLAALLPVTIPSSVHAATPASAPVAGGGANAPLTVPLAVNWKFTSDPFSNNPSAPALANGIGYITTGNRVYAIDLKTGVMKWRYPTDSTLATTIQTTPVVSADTVFIGAGDGLYALSTADGKPRYQPYHLKAGVSTSPVVVDDIVYFGGSDGRIYAIDSKTGEPVGGIWQQGIDAGGAISSDFSITNGMVYYLTGGLIVHARTLSSGAQRWAERLPAVVRGRAAPVLSSESIYLPAGNALIGLRLSTGTQYRYQVLPGEAATSPAVDESGNVYVITSDRNIYALDRNFRGLWRQAAKVDFEVIAAPVVVGNLLMVGTTLGGVYAFDTADGTLKWNYTVDPSSRNANAIPAYANVTTSPVTADGALYVYTDDGTLTSFRADAPDSTPPTVTDIEPDAGAYINGRPPLYFTARLADIGSGLRTDSIKVKLDDQAIPYLPTTRGASDKFGYTFNPDDGLVQFYTVETTVGRSNALSDGHHSVTVIASDWMGNTVNKTWMFYVDDTIPRRTQNTNNTNRQPGSSGSRGGFPGGRPGGFPGGGGGKG